MAKPRKWLRHAGNGSDSLATDSVCLIASDDHELLIAHPGSYDADRCIHRNDHGQPRGRTTIAGKQAAVLAVVVTIAKGYDLGYIWKTQDHTAGRTTGGYYLSAAQAGEPPGRWWGPGAQALGLTPGQTYYFRYYTSNRKGTSNPSQVFSILVK